MSNESNYPRPSQFQGLPPDRLRALGEGYFGMNWVCLANLLCLIGVFFLASQFPSAMAWFFLTQMTIIVAVSYPQAKRLTYGFGSAPAMAYIVPVLLAFNSFICLGLLGFALVMSRVKSFLVDEGYGPKFLSSRKQFEAFMAGLESGPDLYGSGDDASRAA
ncbi:MAG TPA: hypothetical protein VKT78_00390 [Fimbriimonadaceae bacterium]|nr:hypothetical protein [Fimbriimonadaceae bacterium]